MEFIKEYPIEKLQVWENNPRKNDKAADKLTGMIEEYGFINPIIIDQNGTIRAGHTRLKAANKLGQKTVPVLIHNFANEAQAIGYAIADNKTSEWAEWDFEELKDLMQGLDDDGFDLEKTGFGESQLAGILNDMDVDDFFEDSENGEIPEGEPEEDKKTVVCPKCGEEIEI